MSEYQLYSWTTPNGYKINIGLEEFGVPYQYHPIDISKGDQFKPEFVKINPNSKIPALVDPNGYDGKPVTVFESGAILVYLAQKLGKFLPDAKVDPRGNAEVLQWLFFQMGGVGPMFGQFNHFNRYAPEKIQYAIDRYRKETERLLTVMNTQLGTNHYIAGAEYSIADMAIWPWVDIWVTKAVADFSSWPHVKRWHDEVLARPAVKKVWEQAQTVEQKPMSDEAKKILFGIPHPTPVG